MTSRPGVPSPEVACTPPFPAHRRRHGSNADVFTKNAYLEGSESPTDGGNGEPFDPDPDPHR
ncbi:hypothetical protein B005_0584 [Nocardiopsis alba ATCC BAA-2165]|uniref:Uncharacterized protein n=1 Tax=Nocardiopsis alba (strain ATCC BAA-2165 / BE74) TaxID=1205910 RepID=J7LA93_NOCAA|nr:hypothetical protein B005_0584 [Nocardiopsis alba ATCC BAA-2165]